MRPFQIFAAMSDAQAEATMEALAADAPGAYGQALAVAAAAMKARPVFLQKQPAERRARAIRRALSRVAADAIAEEMLAVYFLECRKALLDEWLDGLGIAHEEGTLKDEPSEPEAARLAEAVEAFRKAASDGDRDDRELLLRAFAAQSSISWPALDALL